MMRPSEPALEIARRLSDKSVRRVLLTSHLGIDGDSAGACLSLARVLSHRGIRAVYTNPTPPPAQLSYLDFASHFVPAERAVTEDYDLAMVIDTSVVHRLGDVAKCLERIPRRILVDHHQGEPSAFFEYCWIDSSAAAVVLQAAEIIDALGGPWDEAVANSLWTGLVTDTASFQQSNTDERALAWAARFVHEGAKPFDTATLLFESRRLGYLHLLGRALANLAVEADGKVVWSHLSREDFAAAGALEEDVEGIITVLRAVGGAEIVVLLRESQRDGASSYVKATFRSKGDTDVEKIARALGGGGHRMAAGAEIYSDLASARARVRDAIGLGGPVPGGRSGL